MLVFAVYLLWDAKNPSTDTAGTLQVALSLLHEGDIDLNEFQNHGGNTLNFNRRELYFFPLGTPLLATPFVYVVDRVLERVYRFDLYDYLKTASDLILGARSQGAIAALIAVLICLVIYGIGRLSLSRGTAVALALIFALCTPAWSTASRDLWQPYYLPQRLGSNPAFVSTLTATLISPSQGLFLYAPVLLLAGVGVILKVRAGRFGALDFAIFRHHHRPLAGDLFLCALVGRASSGSRLFTDVMPYFLYFLGPVLETAHLPRTADGWVAATSAGALILASFLIN